MRNEIVFDERNTRINAHVQASHFNKQIEKINTTYVHSSHQLSIMIKQFQTFNVQDCFFMLS